VTWRLRGHARPVPLSAVTSGGLLLAMGVLTVILAFRRQSMATDGWQVRVSATLTHAASVVRDNLVWVPGWALSALVVGALAYLVIRAARARRSSALTTEPAVPTEENEDHDAPASTEDRHTTGTTHQGEPPMTSTRPAKGRPTANPRATSSGSVNARRDKINGVTPPKRRPWLVAAVIAVVILALGGLYLTFRTGSGPSAGKATDYQVGDPGVGAAAPGFTLASTTGTPVSLSSFRGKTVLLYFHEGLGCQPCWDQIRDLHNSEAKLRAAGIDELLSITSGPVDLIAQKMADDKLTATALADTDLSVSVTYNANKFGMMGIDRDGHSFILVGPDGRIQWRADYGGAPRYTMFVPVDRLLADLKAGRRPA